MVELFLFFVAGVIATVPLTMQRYRGAQRRRRERESENRLSEEW